MIAELLRADRIVLGLAGDLSDALDRLIRSSSAAARIEELRATLHEEQAGHWDRIDSATAVPHLRIEGLAAPELLVGVSAAGLKGAGDPVTVLVVLLTPAGETAQHLQLLQRLASLLPEVRQELLGARRAPEVVEIVARGERRAGRTTFLNLTEAQVAFELSTDLGRGLSTAEADRRLRLFGPNRIQRARRTPWLIELGRSFFSFFAVLLWIAAALCFLPAVAMPQLGAAILIVVGANGVFSFVQERKSDHAVEALGDLMAQKCRVVRDGEVHPMDAASLVPGDVVVLEEGDLVPADARLIEAFEVEVDNSSLTGESTSARRYKSDRPVLLPGKFLWIELPNVIFAGTALVRGQARAVVFATGMRTEIGTIAGLTQAIALEDSPLKKQLRRAVVRIALLASGLGLGFLLLGWQVAGLSFLEAFVLFIGLFVANVPEGLLPTVTLALAMGVTRMARRNALVKNLPSVETLGSTTVICCDKTGTLTQNRMMASEIWVDDRRVEVSGVGYAPQGEFRVEGRALGLAEIARWPALRRLLECALACNNARIERAGAEWRVVGDPTEGALACLAEKARVRGTHQRLRVNPLESVRKRMSVVVEQPGRAGATVYVKGAPIELLARCDRILAGGVEQKLDGTRRERIVAQHDALADQGLRLLALAYRDEPAGRPPEALDAETVERDLVLLGLTAMQDPVRPEVPDAIGACHAAGIRVITITGDYPRTAAAVGRAIGLGGPGGGGPLTLVSGADLDSMDEPELRAILARGEPIFARVSPEHKLRVVSTLQQMGEVVAVTGDGVNDAPALKRADIGIAMGLRGNDVAKEAAQMVLADDNFRSIVAAIEEGRGIFDNIRRFAAYVLNSNPQEMYPYILWMLVPGLPLAMTVMGVLAVDVGTDLIPAMGLGIEPPEAGIMERPPRPRDEKLLSLGFILRSYFVQGSLLALSCYLTYYYFAWTRGGVPPSPEGLDLSQASLPYLQSLTAFFFPTVTAQIANVLCKRSSRTSIFSRDFLNAERRKEKLAVLARVRPRRYVARVRIDYRIERVGQIETVKAPLVLLGALLLAPLRTGAMLASRAALLAERPIAAVARWAACFFERHWVLFNFVSNPLIDLGIAVELLLCVAFFYTPLARVYYFAPVGWHVYLFAFHGTLLLFAFEEGKKYLRRRGHPLAWLGEP